MYNKIIGIILSILYSKIILPKEENNIPKINFTLYPIIENGMIIISIPYLTKYKIHIHHWLIYLLIIIIFYNKLNDIIYYFCLGLIIQGLSYKDAFTFIISE